MTAGTLAATNRASSDITRGRIGTTPAPSGLMTATSHIPTGSMSKRRNVRDRRLRRWGLRPAAVDRRNGVSQEGYDPRGVSQILPWCVEAYLARGPITPRMSTRRYRVVEWRNVQPAVRGSGHLR